MTNHSSYNYEITGTADSVVDSEVDHLISWSVSKKSKSVIQPTLYFKYVKSKFSFLEQRRFEGRMKKLEKAFYTAVDNGQQALGDKILRMIALETKNSVLYAKGFRMYVKDEDITRFKRNLQDGHISDTKYENYIKVIPEHVIKRKNEAEGLFDSFIILHYYNKETEKKVEEKMQMTEKEKQDMRDPILFGRIKNDDRWFFIDEWEDDDCDLSFDDIVDKLSLKDSDVVIDKRV